MAVVDTETAAFSVCTTWGILGRKLYLVDVLRKRLEFHKIEPAILHMKDKFRAGCVVMELFRGHSDRPKLRHLHHHVADQRIILERGH